MFLLHFPRQEAIFQPLLASPMATSAGSLGSPLGGDGERLDAFGKKKKNQGVASVSVSDRAAVTEADRHAVGFPTSAAGAKTRRVPFILFFFLLDSFYFNHPFITRTPGRLQDLTSRGLSLLRECDMHVMHVRTRLQKENMELDTKEELM